VTSQALMDVVQRARDRAKEVLTTLEQTGHPQTNESSGVYLALVTLLKRLKAQAAGARLDEYAAEIEQIAALCKGKLEPVKPLLDEAMGIARGRQAHP
jgi:hypothetical protein